MRASYLIALGALASNVAAVELQTKQNRNVVSAVSEVNELLAGALSELEAITLNEWQIEF